MCEKQGAVEVDQKIKTAQGKAPLAILPWPLLVHLDLEKYTVAIEGLAWAFEYGGRKYQPYNFAKAEPNLATAVLYLSAYLRHRQKRQKQERDVESAIPHVDHQSACLIMLLAIMSQHPKLVTCGYEGLLSKAPTYVRCDVWDLFTHSGALRGDFDTFEGLCDFITVLASVTKSHFAYVEKSTEWLKRRRGAEVAPVST